MRLLLFAALLALCSAPAVARNNRPPATLTLTINPNPAQIPADAPLGTIVATATAAWSDGHKFKGRISFRSPYYDDGGTFALSPLPSGAVNIILSPLGLGVDGDEGTVQHASLTATR